MSKHIFSPGHRVFTLIELILNFWCNFHFFIFLSHIVLEHSI